MKFTSLTIGPVVYRVEFVNDLHKLAEGNVKQWLHGEIKCDEALVRIADDQDDQIKLATAWHEALHGILEQAGFAEHPENVICALGYGLISLIRNNPDLIAWTLGNSELATKLQEKGYLEVE